MRVILSGIFIILVSLTSIAENCMPPIEKEELKTTMIPSNEKPETVKLGKIRFEIRHGWGHRLAPIAVSDPVEKAYLKELKNGWTYNTEIEYFIEKSIGVGIAANIFKSSNAIDGVLQTAPNELYPATFSNKHTIWYIGPSISYERLSKNAKHSLIFRYSLGYIHYNDVQNIKISKNNLKQTLTGGSLGVYLDANYTYFLNEHFGVNANVALISGILRSITLRDANGNKIETIKLEKDEYEGLGRVDISLGLVLVL